MSNTSLLKLFLLNPLPHMLCHPDHFHFLFPLLQPPYALITVISLLSIVPTLPSSDSHVTDISNFNDVGRWEKNDMKIIFPVSMPCLYRTHCCPPPHLTSLPGILSLSIQPSYPCSSSHFVITLFPSNQLAPNQPQLGQMLATPQTKPEGRNHMTQAHPNTALKRLRPLPAITPRLLFIS